MTLLLLGNLPLFLCFHIDILRAERLVEKTSLLISNFHLFRFFCLDFFGALIGASMPQLPSVFFYFPVEFVCTIETY